MKMLAAVFENLKLYELMTAKNRLTTNCLAPTPAEYFGRYLIFTTE